MHWSDPALFNSLATINCVHNQALILHLLYERALGERSFWAPYINMLPDQVCEGERKVVVRSTALVGVGRERAKLAQLLGRCTSKCYQTRCAEVVTFVGWIDKFVALGFHTR